MSDIEQVDFEAMSAHSEDAAHLLKAMANPFRLQVLCILGDQELSVGELNKLLPLSQSALSQHLAKLRSDGLVTTRREAQTIFYTVTPGPAQEVITILQQHFCANENQNSST